MEKSSPSSCLSDLPATQDDAKAQGLSYYFTGKPCRHGHLSKRYASSKVCHECQALRQVELRKTPARRETVARYRAANKAEISRKELARREANKEAYYAKQNEYRRTRYAEDPAYRLKCALRARLRKAVVGHVKGGSAVDDLGCSIPELMAHLTQQFQPGMTWDNLGAEWQIDHIKALGLFDLTDPGQFKQAVHYTNLQPLFHADHKVKSAADLRLIRAQRAGE